jgi:hypothetical protein
VLIRRLIWKHSLLKILEYKALDLFKAGGKFFPANTCLSITKCVPVVFGATVFVKALKPDL